MTLRVKICGITRLADARAAWESGADAIGLVFAAGRRTVSLDAARAIAAALPPWFPIVGVFRDQPADAIHAILAAVPLTHLQFHGSEDPEWIAAFPRPVIKALPLCTADHEAHVRAIAAAHPALPLLVDAAEGGSGHACDWSRAADLARSRPLILAGGLTPETVADAVRAVRPAAVDVSSGVESAPGIKDPARIAAFIAAARAAA